jgi:hypothetical protein
MFMAMVQIASFVDSKNLVEAVLAFFCIVAAATHLPYSDECRRKE